MFNVNPRDEFELVVVQDGTTTEATVVHGPTGTIIGQGVAKRRKGDQRLPILGSTLAVQRAFRAAADNLNDNLVELGYGPADGS